nr:hypothetical protein [uncultured Comamonas sp.]
MRGFQPAQGVKKPFPNGGPVRGPGSGTSDEVADTVPKGTYIMPTDSTQAIGAQQLASMGSNTNVPVNLSNGEYKLPPEQVHAIGAQALDQIKDATHTPLPARGFAPGAPQAHEGEPRQFFASGGLVGEDEKRSSAIKQIPVGGHTAPPSDGGQSSELTRNVNNTANALGGMGAVASVGLRGAQTAKQVGNTPLLAGAASKAAPAADFISGMGPGATTYANTIPRLGNAPTASLPGVNAALQEGAQANALAAATRAGSGAGAGANALESGRPQDAAVPATASQPSQPQSEPPASARGLYFADRAQDMSTRWNGGDYAGAVGSGVRTAAEGLGVTVLSAADNVTRPWVDAGGRAWDGVVGNQPQTPAATTTKAQPASASVAGGGRGLLNPAPANPSAPTPTSTQQSATEIAPGIFRNGNSYSDSAVGAVAGMQPRGLPSLQNVAAAEALAQRSQQDSMNRVLDSQQRGLPTATPTFRAPSVSHSGNDYSARKQLENLKTSASSITNTARWGGRNAERNPSVIAYQQALQADLAAQGKQPDMEMQTMGLNAGMAREQMHQDGANTRAAMGERTAAQRLALDGRRLAGDEEVRGFDIRRGERQEKLFQQYEAAKTPEERAAVEQQIRALSGKGDQANRFTVVPGGQEWDTTANVMRNVPARVLNNQTGQFIQGPGNDAAAASLPKAGELRNGFRYKGGNPNEQKNWEPV